MPICAHSNVRCATQTSPRDSLFTVAAVLFFRLRAMHAAFVAGHLLLTERCAPLWSPTHCLSCCLPLQTHRARHYRLVLLLPGAVATLLVCSSVSHAFPIATCYTIATSTGAPATPAELTALWCPGGAVAALGGPAGMPSPRG